MHDIDLHPQTTIHPSFFPSSFSSSIRYLDRVSRSVHKVRDKPIQNPSKKTEPKPSPCVFDSTIASLARDDLQGFFFFFFFFLRRVKHLTLVLTVRLKPNKLKNHRIISYHIVSYRVTVKKLFYLLCARKKTIEKKKTFFSPHRYLHFALFFLVFGHSSSLTCRLISYEPVNFLLSQIAIIIYNKKVITVL